MSIQIPILSVYDDQGTEIPIPAIRGSQGPQGIQGVQGPAGQNGTNGQDGHTPVKGTDYWTAADKQGIVNDVLAALPTWSGGSY